MKKKKYFYNTVTHRFERLIVPWRTRVLRLLGFLSASTVTGLILAALAFRYLPSPSTQRSSGDLARMQEKYTALQRTVNMLDSQLAQLEQRDNEVYRVIFESAPLPDSIRRGKSYGAETRSRYAYTASEQLISNLQRQLSGLQARAMTQKSSLDTLEQMARTKEKMLAAIPAVQPISNKNLSHIASGFGYRIDPIYKTPKLHTGLDFAAPQGTPIYATADGTVEKTGFDDGGYGNHVIIRHGFGYQTLYGHMVRIKATPGTRVERGQLIGWVGSTGKSTGPHCHYEVIKNGNKIDPVHYFFNDLSPQDYERLVRIAAANNQAFD